jgi:hypothetical protein
MSSMLVAPSVECNQPDVTILPLGQIHLKAISRV